MKTVEDARYLRDGILLKFEMAEVATDPQERAEWLTFVVIGAGPTGVELVGQIAELAHSVLPRDYRSVDTTEARIILLEGADSVLPSFRRKLQSYTKRRLEQMGVEVRLGTLAVDIDNRSVTVQGPNGLETIRTRTRIWAAGVQASPLARILAAQAGVETDRAGRIPVEPDCTLPGHAEVFAIGDMVSLSGLPGVAQPAIQEGKYVATVIKARLDGAPHPGPFRYFDKGSMATIGYRSAVADAFGRPRHRSPRLPDVGGHPRGVPGRLGQPPGHALHVGPRAVVLAQQGPPDHHLRPGGDTCRPGPSSPAHSDRARRPGLGGVARGVAVHPDRPAGLTREDQPDEDAPSRRGLGRFPTRTPPGTPVKPRTDPRSEPRTSWRHAFRPIPPLRNVVHSLAPSVSSSGRQSLA
jgi:Pyridine nucleotide-disulphide oxidoreductase